MQNFAKSATWRASSARITLESSQLWQVTRTLSSPLASKTSVQRSDRGRIDIAFASEKREGCRAIARNPYKNMSEHKVTLKWERGGAEFSYQKYPRDHTWSFDGGHTMAATAAPAYLGNPANVDPEEAFVASLASCHMLTFLSIACKQKFVLDLYEDEAVGHMEKNADGKLAITRVELRPKITWSGNRRPSTEELDKMHHAAHENCFIANSVKTNVTVAER